MKFKAILASTVLLHAPAFAQSECEERQEKIAAVNAKYQAMYDDFDDEAEELEGMSATFDVEVEWVDTSLSMDLPSVTIRDQEMSFDVPQVTMKLNEISFDTPSVRMVAQKIGQSPNVVCKDTWIKVGPLKTKGPPDCKTYWTDIITHVPETFTETQTIKTHTPEIRMERVEIVMGVPEFTMMTQEIVTAVPQFTVNSIAINYDKIETESEQLNFEIAEATEQQKRELASATSALFQCQRSDIQAQKQAALLQFDGPLAQMESTIRSLEEQGASNSEVYNSLSQKRLELNEQRKLLAAQFDDALAELDASEKEVIDRLFSSTNGEVA